MRITDGWLDTALDGHYGAKSMSRQGYKPTMIVVHGTAGGSSAQAIDAYFSTSGVQASSHFIIGQDGTIVQGIDCNQAAFGNGVLTTGYADFLPQFINPNLYTISIEHCKPLTDNSDQLTQAQQDASFALIECLCDAYGIPRCAADARGGVLSHADFDPVNRSRCPGPYPWDQLWVFLKGNSMQTYGPKRSADFDHWFVDQHNGTWKCKQTGAILMGGNLALYRSLSIDGNTLPVVGLPLESEHYQTDSDGYHWSTQKCERAQIVYDPAHRHGSQPGMGSSYLAHIQYGLPKEVIVEKNT